MIENESEREHIKLALDWLLSALKNGQNFFYLFQKCFHNKVNILYLSIVQEILTKMPLHKE